MKYPQILCYLSTDTSFHPIKVNGINSLFKGKSFRLHFLKDEVISGWQEAHINIKMQKNGKSVAGKWYTNYVKLKESWLSNIKLHKVEKYDSLSS